MREVFGKLCRSDLLTVNGNDWWLRSSTSGWRGVACVYYCADVDWYTSDIHCSVVPGVVL